LVQLQLVMAPQGFVVRTPSGGNRSHRSAAGARYSGDLALAEFAFGKQLTDFLDDCGSEHGKLGGNAAGWNKKSPPLELSSDGLLKYLLSPPCLHGVFGIFTRKAALSSVGVLGNRCGAQ
jgi:hypothetical protein